GTGAAATSTRPAPSARPHGLSSGASSAGRQDGASQCQHGSGVIAPGEITTAIALSSDVPILAAAQNGDLADDQERAPPTADGQATPAADGLDHTEGADHGRELRHVD